MNVRRIQSSSQCNHCNSDSSDSDNDSNSNQIKKNILLSPKILSNSIDINNFELVDTNNNSSINNINNNMKNNNQSPSPNKVIKNVSIVGVESNDHAASIINALRKSSISSRRYQRETTHIITSISEFDQIVTAKGLEVEEKQHVRL
jgi:hypothetical protein